MLRRPPAEGRLVARPNTKKALLAWAVLLLPWLSPVDALQQQQHARYHQAAVIPDVADADHDAYRHNLDNIADSAGQRRRKASVSAANLAATSAQSVLDNQGTPTIGYKSTIATVQHRYRELDPSKHIQIPDDASALATTLAPAPPVRAPFPSRHLSSLLPRGLSSLHQTARSLGDWEVEDFVLLATVDGHLHAVDRDSGDERWHLEVEQPAVETIHHNTSGFGESTSHPLYGNIWAIEPTRNGPLYVWTQSELGSGLMSTGLTMKQLVDDHVPYAVPDPPVVYNGHKKTTLITLDAFSGRVIKWFGPGSPPQVDESATCYRPNGRFAEGDGECVSSGTITLSRTEYTVTIDRLDRSEQIATLKYTEWGPNNADSDLHDQYRTSPRERYITSRTDGKLYVIGPAGKWALSLQSSVPVANVFEIGRPEDAPPGSNPELVLFPQPIPATKDDATSIARSNKVFLNQTESGSWYAMSGSAYPLILDAPTAPLSHSSIRDINLDPNRSKRDQIAEALVGTHALGQKSPHWPTAVPGLPAPPEQEGEEEEGIEQTVEREEVSQVSSKLAENISHFPDIVTENILSLPDYITRKATDFLTNPVVILVGIYFLITKRRDLARYLKGTQKSEKAYDATITLQPAEAARQATKTETKEDVAPIPAATDLKAEVLPKGEVAVIAEKVAPTVLATEGPALAAAAAAEQTKHDDSLGEQDGPVGPESPDKKKKAHRGRRGGVKHRKGVKKQDSTGSKEDNGSDELNDVVPGIQNVGMPADMEPNITTINNDPEDVSGPILRIGDIEVNQDVELGMGSNGTIVFSGKFHGRDVAVKRMLTQFWEIATQETRLLLESDKHPNVIQYFAMSKSDTFLYIALELCQASLSDVVDKSHQFPELARAGEMDMPRVLLQIAHGLSFLHDLRIVHRDLKPQNILVTMGRDGKPRLLVSDFGLCKKLEGGQSSFGATTAHAAGTSGWRAPELLVDDDTRDGSHSMSSIHSDSSQLAGSDTVSNRRATRAIDIFSLGLVFFYVLTKGSHPFDCGDRYMREVNIRKGRYDLGHLDVLGDVAFEAKALIDTMLKTDAKARPTAREVMCHPFFWTPKERLAFLCDVSDHFELECRDPPSKALSLLESYAPKVCRGDFLKVLPREFVDSLGKQRKYTGTRMLDLLRALRNKRFHYGDMNDNLKRMVGGLPEGYLNFWSTRFPNLLIVCCEVIYRLDLETTDTFCEYFKPRTP
ncbi:serine/threonine-protein kinase/endoribonuclease IRE1 [Microdochium nivale]|nr:serine/threonine-protein kinase/endoribonuclease IRE1 [Microdochium nivale]